MIPVPSTRQEERERGDPYEMETPIPLAVLLLVAGMVVFGMFYILASAPDGRPELGDRRTLDDLRPVVAAPGLAGVAQVDGAAIYAARCASCHQASGLGLPGVFPPLAQSEWVEGDAARLASILLHGIQGELTVKGVAYAGAMPGFREQLDDASIAAVASHIRSQWGNAAPAIEAAAVAAARSASASRTTPWNGDAELASIK
jgi:mono/diheme cytochrome c family protein